MVPEHNVATNAFAEGGWSTRLTRKCNVATAGQRGNGEGDPTQWNTWDYEPMADVIQIYEMCTLYAVRMQCEKDYLTAFCGQTPTAAYPGCTCGNPSHTSIVHLHVCVCVCAHFCRRSQ